MDAGYQAAVGFLLGELGAVSCVGVLDDGGLQQGEA